MDFVSLEGWTTTNSQNMQTERLASLNPILADGHRLYGHHCLPRELNLKACTLSSVTQIIWHGWGLNPEALVTGRAQHALASGLAH